MPICSALVKADVPQHIPVIGSGVSVKQIAKEVEKEGAAVDAGVLYRYMRYLSSVGVFEERQYKRFVHNTVSTSLLQGNNTFFFLRLHGSAEGGTLPVAEYFSQLRAFSIHSHTRTSEQPHYGIGFFEHLAKSPSLETLYAQYMTLLSEMVMPDLLANIELPDECLVADVGGKRGHDVLAFFDKSHS